MERGGFERWRVSGTAANACNAFGAMQDVVRYDEWQCLRGQAREKAPKQGSI